MAAISDRIAQQLLGRDLPEDQFLRRVLRNLFWLIVVGVAVVISQQILIWRLGIRPRAMPFVLAVENKHVVGVAHPLASSDAAMLQESIAVQLDDFIFACRQVLPNPEQEQHNIDIVYNKARGQAYQALEDYYRGRKDRDPKLLAQQGYWRQPTIMRHAFRPDPLKQPDDWRIEWREIEHPPNGEPTTTYWEADIGILPADRVGPIDDYGDTDLAAFYVVSLAFRPAVNLENVVRPAQ